MTDWWSACPMFGLEWPAAGITCAVLLALLVAAVALGFGPLRARLDWPASPPESPRAPLDSVAGLWDTWRLVRRLPHVADGPDASPRPAYYQPSYEGKS